MALWRADQLGVNITSSDAIDAAATILRNYLKGLLRSLLSHHLESVVFI